jgi:hypothetical protein
MSELITGVISGIVASVMFYIFLWTVRPRIYVSDKICKINEDESGMFIRIKVVNRTGFILTNVKYVLNFCRSQGDGIHKVEVIPPCITPLEFIDKYSASDENAEYAIRFLYKIPPHIRISDGWLEFSIHANHGFSNTSACVKKKYVNDDIIAGIFETGTSMKILAIPNS